MAKAHPPQEPSTRALLLAAIGIALLVLFLFNIEKFFPDPKLQLPPTPQRVPIALDAERGTHPGAAHTLIMFTDFQCPYCHAALPVVRELEQRYGTNLNVIVAHFPVPELHSNAQKAAEATECARAQGKFREYHDILFQNQQDLAVPALLQYAELLELDDTSFARCLTNGEMEEPVAADVRLGISAGVRGTPTFFVDGFKIEGLQPADTFTAIFGASGDVG